MAQATYPDHERTTRRILRDLLRRLAEAREPVDVAIAAGIALNELDGVDDSD